MLQIPVLENPREKDDKFETNLSCIVRFPSQQEEQQTLFLKCVVLPWWRAAEQRPGGHHQWCRYGYYLTPEVIFAGRTHSSPEALVTRGLQAWLSERSTWVPSFTPVHLTGILGTPGSCQPVLTHLVPSEPFRVIFFSIFHLLYLFHT